MTEPAASPPARSICPWCSADLPSAAAPTCPSCGATLIGEAETALPGVTAIDAEAIVRGARTGAAPRRSGLLAWITGDEEATDETPAQPGSLEPPPPDVRREMLRMEIEAEVLDLQAEAESLAAAAREEAELAEDEQALEAIADDAAATAADVSAEPEPDAPPEQRPTA